MWTISLSHWWEFVIRAVVIYLFLLATLRLTGKRQVGQLAPFDLVLLMVLSNAVQNAMNGGDNSITGGLILAGTLIVLNLLVGYLSFRSKRMEAIIEGRPIILVHHGQVNQRAMIKAKMTMHDLHACLRADGFTGPEDVLIAVLENNGRITALPRKKQ
jgi:uncharacterized membrane protein YcaP (DUF421 family)